MELSSMITMRKENVGRETPQTSKTPYLVVVLSNPVAQKVGESVATAALRKEKS